LSTLTRVGSVVGDSFCFLAHIGLEVGNEVLET